MQVGLDIVTSTICKSNLQFGQDKQLSTLVLKFNFIFSISSGYGQTEFYFPTCTKPCSLAANLTDTTCLRVESHIALVSYLPAETEAVMVRRFEKNSGFATLADTFSLSSLSSSYQNKKDTLEIFASYGTDNGLLSTYDYEIYLPGMNRLYQLTDITEAFESMNQGLSCRKVECLNSIRSYKVNGQLMNGNPEYAFYLVK